MVKQKKRNRFVPNATDFYATSWSLKIFGDSLAHSHTRPIYMIGAQMESN